MVVARAGKLSLEVDLYILLRVLPNSSGKNNIRLGGILWRRRMLIGQFNDSYPPVMDGVANVTKNYAYWLNKKYGQCYVVTPAFPGYRDQDPFPVMRYMSFTAGFRPPYRLRVSAD